ncbi:MAG: sugar phosphate nucleotidyltransferase [Rhodoferax sp.]
MVRLLVLAGGFGTRLRSAVAEVPKPLAPVNGRPYLQYLIESWVEQGVSELTFLLHYQAEMIADFLLAQQRTGSLGGCALKTVVEPRPLGTGGAIAFAVRELKMAGTFLVANADTWIGSGIQQLVLSDAPSMAAVKVENSERYGSVQIENNKVVTFKEKQESTGPGWINAGLYHLDCSAFQRWNGEPYSVERDLFPFLADSRQLNAVALSTDFIDIGIPQDYFRFCRWIESGKTGEL